MTDDMRATMHSIFGSIAALSFSVLSPLVGMSLDGWGAIPTYWAMGVAVCVGALLLGVWLSMMKASAVSTGPS